MKAMKKLTAIMCVIGMSMLGAQAIASSGPQDEIQINKQTRTQTMSGTQTGPNTRTRTSY